MGLDVGQFSLYRVDYNYEQPAMKTTGVMYVCAKSAEIANRYVRKYIRETYKESYNLEIKAKVESHTIHIANE